MDSLEKVKFDSADKDSSVSVELETSTSQRNGNLEEGNDLANMKLGNSDAVAKGISSMIMNIIRDFDTKADNTLKSQSHLSSSLNRLAEELDQLLEDAPFPFIMQQASRISSVRKRVLSLNSLLKSIQRRVDNIDRVLSVNNLKGTDSSEVSVQHQHV